MIPVDLYRKHMSSAVAVDYGGGSAPAEFAAEASASALFSSLIHFSDHPPSVKCI